MHGLFFIGFKGKNIFLLYFKKKKDRNIIGQQLQILLTKGVIQPFYCFKNLEKTHISSKKSFNDQ